MYHQRLGTADNNEHWGNHDHRGFLLHFCPAWRLCWRRQCATESHPIHNTRRCLLNSPSTRRGERVQKTGANRSAMRIFFTTRFGEIPHPHCNFTQIVSPKCGLPKVLPVWCCHLGSKHRAHTSRWVFTQYTEYQHKRIHTSTKYDLSYIRPTHTQVKHKISSLPLSKYPSVHRHVRDPFLWMKTNISFPAWFSTCFVRSVWSNRPQRSRVVSSWSRWLHSLASLRTLYFWCPLSVIPCRAAFKNTCRWVPLNPNKENHVQIFWFRLISN